MNESVGKHTVKCFRHAMYHTGVFNMMCLGVCKCDHMSFPARPVWSYNLLKLWKMKLPANDKNNKIKQSWFTL